ncbi:hypothetical protein ACFLTN_06965 [Chloroflexota bacterium]
MATGKLLGTDTAGTGQLYTSYIYWSKFPGLGTGLCTSLLVRVLVNGYARLALYTDNAGHPGNLIAETASQAVTAGTWAEIDLSSTPIVLGVDYWIAWQGTVNGAGAYRELAGGQFEYKWQPYGAFPATGAGATESDGYECSFQGFGVLVVTPTSIVQPISYGTPTVEVGTGGLTIYPTSIVQVISIGTPSLLYPQTVTPSSIVQAIVVGTPAVIGGETGELRIFPTSIVQPISIGSPTLYKYVWHVILDGEYNIDSPETNRTHVIGRDVYGNPVFGSAVDSTELGLVGERLDFQHETAIPTVAQAESMAGAILAKMRLTGKRGVILIPPNCGQELFDVVEVTDTKSNQTAVKFRVVGIRFEYNPKQARYQHKIILGAP